MLETQVLSGTASCERLERKANMSSLLLSKLNCALSAQNGPCENIYWKGSSIGDERFVAINLAKKFHMKLTPWLRVSQFSNFPNTSKMTIGLRPGQTLIG